jgi:hypothetical protein
MSPLGLHYLRVDNSMKTLVDVGAGRGDYFKRLKEFDSEQKFAAMYSVGLDASSEALKIAKKSYSDVVQCDIRKMPIKQHSIDVVICDDVIEHLQKKHGKQLLADIEQVSIKLIIVTTQVGFVSHVHGEDTWQIHRSGWMPKELEKQKYKVYGTGGLKKTFESVPPKIMSFPFVYIPLMILTHMILYPERPDLAAQMTCLKSVAPNKS